MEAVRFDTKDRVTLEGEIRRPEGRAQGTAVLCHAHPRHGGSKDHPLLWAIRKELASRGLVVIGFNFRGIMGSGGGYGGGAGEVEDVRAAVGCVREGNDGPTLVCGWSFGAHVALRAALEDDRVAALALMGLPLDQVEFSLPPLPNRHELLAFHRPVLLLAGQADHFCPLPELRALARRLPRATVEVLSGADHFLWRREANAARVVGDFACRVLSGEMEQHARGRPKEET